MRFSRRPNKQLFWFWVEDIMKESEGMELGLDIACGYMKTKHLFRTKDYFGIDASEERIRKGSMVTGGNGMACKIEDMPPDLKGDFVVCLQAMGINQFFKRENTTVAFEKCVHATKVGGSLLVNVGPESQDYLVEIENLAHRYFRHVDVREYGRCFRSVNNIFSYIIALFFYYFPQFARTNDTPFVLIYCRERKAS